jgi:ankyrin repeat protein
MQEWGQRKSFVRRWRMVSGKGLVPVLLVAFAGLTLGGCAPSASQISEFYTAVWNGDLGRTESMLAQNPRLLNVRAETAYSGATGELLSVGVEDVCGKRAIYTAVSRGHEKIVALLIKHGTAVNDEKRRSTCLAPAGMSPLHIAAMDGRTDIAQLLIDAGADVNATDGARGRTTPLDLALREGHSEMVQLLREYGGVEGPRGRLSL